jgi:hypothetical protein
MFPFAQFRRQAQILILKILNVFLWLKFSPSLALNKIERFSEVSICTLRSSGFARLEFVSFCDIVRKVRKKGL